MALAPRLIALSLVLSWLAASPAQAQDLIGERRPCQETVDAQLKAWVGLHSCRGELVIDMRRDCSLIQSYATGDCGHAVR